MPWWKRRNVRTQYQPFNHHIFHFACIFDVARHSIPYKAVSIRTNCFRKRTKCRNNIQRRVIKYIVFAVRKEGVQRILQLLQCNDEMRKRKMAFIIVWRLFANGKNAILIALRSFVSVCVWRQLCAHEIYLLAMTYRHFGRYKYTSFGSAWVLCVVLCVVCEKGGNWQYLSAAWHSGYIATSCCGRAEQQQISPDVITFVLPRVFRFRVEHWWSVLFLFFLLFRVVHVEWWTGGKIVAAEWTELSTGSSCVMHFLLFGKSRCVWRSLLPNAADSSLFHRKLASMHSFLHLLFACPKQMHTPSTGQRRAVMPQFTNDVQFCFFVVRVHRANWLYMYMDRNEDG